MNKKKKFANDMIPGSTFHPGEYLKEEIEARDISQQELARKMKVSKSEISLIINGHRNINPKIAVLLELALGIDAEIWMNLQVNHDIDLIKIKMRDSIRKAKISKTKKEKFKKLVAAA